MDVRNIFRFAFTFFCILLKLFPVYCQYEILVPLRSVHFQQSVGLFCIITREKEPIFGWAFTTMAQVEINRWHTKLKSNFHVAVIFVNTYEANGRFEILPV